MMPGGGMGRPMGMPPGAIGNEEMFKLMQEDINLEQQARNLAANLNGDTPKKDREELKKKLAEFVEKQFDVRQKRRELELKNLEDELKRLREVVDRRAKARKTIIEKRLSDLIGPEEPGMEF
jgi:hypothetical protein